jgi:magnesium chelatase family protein
MESAALQSIAGGFCATRWRQRPFRAPHHSASAVALVGGGAVPRPGEISLAHHGVLFLDELPEFERKVLEVLREPIEAGHVMISRAARQTDFPCRFQFVAAMNPCPCGYLGHPQRACRCTPDAIARYQGRISGPLLDRIDMQLAVPAMSTAELLDAPAGECSERIADRVALARERQLARQQIANAQLSSAAIDRYCQPDAAASALLRAAIERLHWSARAYHRVLKVARTIADLAGSESIGSSHAAEAIQYRRALPSPT